jgi:outer membrane protein OmpA-like peptidoglycan-associated protein
MKLKISALTVLLCAFAAAQVPNPTSQTPIDQNPNGVASGTSVSETGETVPLFKVQVVSRSIEAVNYWHLGPKTKVDFMGTTLMPDARGEAHVQGKAGRIVVNTKFKNVGPASAYGPEYLTYVLWAITPEGRAQNLGELPLKDGKCDLDVTTDLQTFGLMVTAEPYFSVTQPSDVVVLENKILPETRGQVEEVTAKYELLPRGQYLMMGNPKNLQPVPYEKGVPLGLLEARMAVRLAQEAEADVYAADSLAKAQASLDRAEDYYRRKQGKPIETAAREAAEKAEDARVIAIRRREQESIDRRAAAERRRTEEARQRATAAEAEQQRESEQRAKAEADLRAAEEARRQAEQAQRDAEQARQQALAAQQSAEQQRQLAEQQAQQEKTALRQRLQQQLNTILQTRDTARGLIVNMSDILFDTGKYTLKPGAREKLAKVAGILLAYPGLKVQVEGYTDTTGSPEFNQRLSEQRAATVRDYLVQQGINLNSVTAAGFGESNPVASNSTSSGRQQNRRVEMVVSGEPIGDVASLNNNAPAGTPSAYDNNQQPASAQPQQTPRMPAAQQSTIPH